MSQVKESLTCFAVRIDGNIGPRFATGYNSTPAMFLKRKQAMAYCKELRTHLVSKCSVVKVHVALTEVV